MVQFFHQSLSRKPLTYQGRLFQEMLHYFCLRLNSVEAKKPERILFTTTDLDFPAHGSSELIACLVASRFQLGALYLEAAFRLKIIQNYSFRQKAETSKTAKTAIKAGFSNSHSSIATASTASIKVSVISFLLVEGNHKNSHHFYVLPEYRFRDNAKKC